MSYLDRKLHLVKISACSFVQYPTPLTTVWLLYTFLLKWLTIYSINESDFEDTCLQQAETSLVDDLCKKDFENEIDFDTQCMFSFGVGSKRVENFNFVIKLYSLIFINKITYEIMM